MEELKLLYDLLDDRFICDNEHGVIYTKKLGVSKWNVFYSRGNGMVSYWKPIGMKSENIIPLNIIKTKLGRQIMANRILNDYREVE